MLRYLSLHTSWYRVPIRSRMFLALKLIDEIRPKGSTFYVPQCLVIANMFRGCFLRTANMQPRLSSFPVLCLCNWLSFGFLFTDEGVAFCFYPRLLYVLPLTVWIVCLSMHMILPGCLPSNFSEHPFGHSSAYLNLYGDTTSIATPESFEWLWDRYQFLSCLYLWKQQNFAMSAILSIW